VWQYVGIYLFLPFACIITCYGGKTDAKVFPFTIFNVCMRLDYVNEVMCTCRDFFILNKFLI